MKPILSALLCVCAVASGTIAADGPCIIPGRGHFRIETGTSGLFGAFAHEHLIEAQEITGCAAIDPQNLTRSSVKLTFATAKIRVMDPNEAKDRPKVQMTMETEVLKVSEYPQIVFESTGIEPGGTADAFRVRGNLTIRGKSQAVIVPVTLTRMSDGVYRAVGSYKFKQTTFGIQPVQLAGGTVKVKDEVKTDFELYLK
jgi:polyisoprenoid-binding protein YceI